MRAEAVAQAATEQQRKADELARQAEEIKNQLVDGTGGSVSSGSLSLMG